MQTFKQQHKQAEPLLLGNVWDVASAQSAQRAGYQALGTSSAALAATLGYEDGEQMPFSELKYMVKRIAASSLLPLSVDIEAGFSREPEVIASHIQQLAELGVVGVNIEDSRVEKSRTLVSMEAFTNLLNEVVKHLRDRQVEMFINVRCDAFLLGLENAREEALKRALSYQKAGADGLFFPCISAAEDIKAVVEGTNLPVNVMAMPELPAFDALTKLGVKRISTGNFAHDNIYRGLTQQLTEIRQVSSCAPLFS